MWIEHIRFSNYRQYRNEKISLKSPLRGPKITVIQGANGAGKTNILNGITWCLYGKELHSSKTKYAGLPIYNLLSANELKIGEDLEVEAEILLNSGKEEKIQITRTAVFSKGEDGEIKSIPDLTSDSEDGSKLMAMRLIRKEWTKVTDPFYVVRRIIPENLEEYFFFDGEKLDQYFRETSGEKIRDAVLRISQIGLLEKVIDHLDSKKSDYIRSAKNLGSRAKELADELEKKRSQQKKMHDELEDRRSAKNEAERSEMEYQEKLRYCAVQGVDKIQSEREKVYDGLNVLAKRTAEIEKDRFEQLVISAPFILLTDPIAKSLSMIQDSEASGEIPPEFRRSFITKLLQKDECICGRPLKKKSKERDLVEILLEGSKTLSELEGELMRESGIMNQILQSHWDTKRSISTMKEALTQLEQDREERQERLAYLDQQIASCNIEEVKRWEVALRDFKQTKEDLMAEIAQRELRIKDIVLEQQRMKSNLDEELGKEEKHKDLVRTLDFCQSCLDSANRVKTEIMEEVRQEIEKKTREQFLKLIWKKSTYKDVLISEDYVVSVKDYSGNESIGTLSAGERQVLALSFVAALNSVSGFDLPLIIDTPLGRISKDPKGEIAKNLPHYLEDKQVILLVTDEEYSREVRSSLNSSTAAEYAISFKEDVEGGVAKVMPYE